MSSFRQIRLLTTELTTTECLKISHRLIVFMLASSFLIESTPTFSDNKGMHKNLRGFDFEHIQTADIGPEETVALTRKLFKIFDDFTCWLSGERSLPFWLLA